MKLAHLLLILTSILLTAALPAQTPQLIQMPLSGQQKLAQAEAAPAVDMETSQLLQEARDALERENVAAAEKNVNMALARLDGSNSEHLGPWAHGHATQAGVWVEHAISAAAAKRISEAASHARKALEAADLGLFSHEDAETLHSKFPIMYARLLEEKYWACWVLCHSPGTPSGHMVQYWSQAMENANAALAATRNPVVQARVNQAVSVGLRKWADKHERFGSFYADAVNYAQKAVSQSAGQEGGEIVHAKSLVSLGMATFLEANHRGITSVRSPELTQALSHIRNGHQALVRVMPQSSSAKQAAALIAQYEKDLRAEQMGRAVNLLEAFFGGGGASDESAERAYYQMQNENRAAARQGQPPPHAGIPAQ